MEEEWLVGTSWGYDLLEGWNLLENGLLVDSLLGASLKSFLWLFSHVFEFWESLSASNLLLQKSLGNLCFFLIDKIWSDLWLQIVKIGDLSVNSHVFGFQLLKVLGGDFYVLWANKVPLVLAQIILGVVSFYGKSFSLVSHWISSCIHIKFRHGHICLSSQINAVDGNFARNFLMPIVCLIRRLRSSNGWDLALISAMIETWVCDYGVFNFDVLLLELCQIALSLWLVPFVIGDLSISQALKMAYLLELSS